MPPEFERNGSKTTQSFPVRSSMNPGAAGIASMVSRSPQLHQGHTPHQQIGPSYISSMAAPGHEHLEGHEPPQLSLFRHSSIPTSNDRPMSIVTGQGETLYWKKGVGYVPPSQLPSNQRNPSPMQNTTQPAIQPPFISKEDDIPRVLDTQPSAISVEFHSERRSPGNILPAAPSSGSSTPRRGRPPMSSTSMTPRVEIPVMTPKKLGRPFKNPQSATPSQTAPKKRGRPFRTPEAAAKAAARAATKTPAKSTASVHESRDGFPKKRGRPFKVPLTQVDVPIPEPKFNVFICEWKECPAELHNAETLRLHLHAVHCKRDTSTNMVPCLWKRCGTIEEVLDEETQVMKTVEKRTEFRHRRDWRDHVETAHLLHVLWHQGDGPKGTDLTRPIKKTEKETSPWLYDESGRQVTPSVKGQEIEMGVARENNARRFKKKREGMYVILEPIETLESYMKAVVDDSGELEDGMNMD